MTTETLPVARQWTVTQGSRTRRAAKCQHGESTRFQRELPDGTWEFLCSKGLHTFRAQPPQK